MLKRTLLAVGVLALVASLLCAMAGRAQPALFLLVWGLVLTLGILYEPWRYKGLRTRAGARGRPSGERFVDPETGKLVEVYFDPDTGERTYVQVDSGRTGESDPS